MTAPAQFSSRSARDDSVVWLVAAVAGGLAPDVVLLKYLGWIERTPKAGV